MESANVCGLSSLDLLFFVDIVILINQKGILSN